VSKRLLIADDAALFREGLASLLTDHGFEVVARTDRVEHLSQLVARERPDLAILDVRMPPSHTTEGLQAGLALRRDHPGIAILILSQYVETRFATELLAEDPSGVGYLLKQRVSDVDALLAAIDRLLAGGSVIDPEIVTLLIGRKRRPGPLERLTDRERHVLELMAQGRANHGIADQLTLSLRTVETHVRSIFTKLELQGTTDDHRRVLAVLTYLEHLDP
jgi:DNA-binding NarL/FixJ family response regulator